MPSRSARWRLLKPERRTSFESNVTYPPPPLPLASASAAGAQAPTFFPLRISTRRTLNSQRPRLHRCFPTARAHTFDRSDVVVPNDQCLVEVIYRRANMARQKIENLTDSR